MFEMLKPNERYIIGGYIKRGNETVLDIAVEAIDTPESIRKAMNTVRRAMTNYAPKTMSITIDADQAQTAHVSAQVTTSAAGQADAASEPATVPLPAATDHEPDPQPMPTIAPASKPDGPVGVAGCSGCTAGNAETLLTPSFGISRQNWPVNAATT